MKLATSCVALLAIGGLAACGENVISKDEVEKQATTVITQEVGKSPKSIVCPDDLKAEVGATMKCELTAGDESKLDVNIKVTSAEDGKARFDVEVGREIRR